MDLTYHPNRHMVLNNRWLFVAERDQLVDLEGHVDSVALKPIAARILAILVTNPQTILSRRRLLDEGWRAFGFEVCEGSLNQVMSTLRSTFAALHPGQPYIKTIPRVGYCLLADIRPATAGDLVEPPGNPSGRPASSNITSSEKHLAPRTLDEMLDEQWARGLLNDRPLSLLMIRVIARRMPGKHDLDTPDEHTYGPVMSRIHSCLYRPDDRLVRHDTNIIGVILPNTHQDGAACVANRICAAFRAGSVNLTYAGEIRIGIACTTSHGEKVTLLDAALSALLQNTEEDQDMARCRVTTTVNAA